MRIAISADSTCDLPGYLAKKYDIRLNAMPFSLGENDLRHDGVSGTSEDVFDYVDKTGQLPTTSAFNEYEYTEHFSNILKEYDAVIHFSFSWEISSTGSNARRAAEAMENVYTIDTRTVSGGISLLVLECVDLVKQGLDVKEIVKIMEERKNKVQASFLVDTLNYLHKGGRCSSLALLGANILKIKPRISLIEGKMEVTKKYKGPIGACALKYIDEIVTEVPPQTKRAIVITSSIIGVEDKIKQKLQELGFEEIIEAKAGPSICIHCGKGTVGVMYMAQ